MPLQLFPSADDYPLGPPPEWTHPVMIAICLLSVLLPPGIIRLGSGAALLGVFSYALLWTRSQTVGAYSLGAGCAGTVFRWLDFVAIHRPEGDFWRVEDGKKVRETLSGAESKLKWFTDLWFAKRGIGWNIQQKSLPPSSPIGFPRIIFLRNCIIRIIAVGLGYDLCSTVRFVTTDNAPFFTHPFAKQVLLAWTKAFRAYYTFELMYYLLATSSVLFNLCSPQEWPPLTGSFRRDAWSIRNMWGKCWHQMARRECGEAGRLVEGKVRVQDGEFHEQILPSLGGFEDKGYWQAVYFMIQPVGIMMEDFVIWVGKLMGLKETVWTKRVGFLWVIMWFSWTLRFMVAFQPTAWAQSAPAPSPLSFALKAIGLDNQQGRL